MDRGPQSIECLLTLLAFKIALPNNFFITRGNHESELMHLYYGFKDDCIEKYNVEFNALCFQVMYYLPIAHLVENKIFIVHGGLPNTENVMIDSLRGAFRVYDPIANDSLHDWMWVDPFEGDGIRKNYERGLSHVFGSDITHKFIAR